MSTGLYASDTPDILGSSHGQILRATATHPDWDAALDLNVTEAVVTFDESMTPRVTAQLTIAARTLDELAQLAAIDPRTGVRVELLAGYVRPDGDEDVQDVANLGIRRVTVDRPEAVCRLELASDEALVIDSSPAINAPVNTATTADAIAQLIKQTIAPAPVIVKSVTGPAAKVDVINDRWAAIADLADRIGARVYDDGTRTFHIELAPTKATTPTVTLTSGPGGTLIATSDAVDRDEWANYVTLEYSWRDGADVPRVIRSTALVTTGTYSTTGPAGRRILLDKRALSATQAEANAASLALLRRQVTRSLAQRVTAIATWWLRPGDTVRTTTTASGTSDRLVSRVAFSWPSGRMDVVTRYPDEALGEVTTTTPAPVTPPTPPPAPPAAPDPEPPPKQTYTSRWKMSSSATYRGSGVKRTDLPGETAHGQSSSGSINGNQRSILLFTAANSTGDETGKTITQALTGADVISVRLRAYATWWYSYSGGSTRFGALNVTALPATFTSTNPYKTETGWPRNSWRTVNLSGYTMAQVLKSGGRGVTVGPWTSTSTEGYGKLSAAGSTIPELEITYSK